MISELLTRLRFLIRRKNGELDEEIEFHLEQAIARAFLRKCTPPSEPDSQMTLPIND